MASERLGMARRFRIGNFIPQAPGVRWRRIIYWPRRGGRGGSRWLSSDEWPFGGLSMQHFDLIRFKSDRELADSVAAKWLAAIRASKGARYGVALSGGRIAGKLFAALAGLSGGTPDVLEKVDWFWGDERCVLPDDPESNFGLAQRL